MTEKKKRIPKPQKSNYTKILLEGLGFFNIENTGVEPDSDLLRETIPLFRQILSDDFFEMDVAPWKYIKPWSEDKKAMDEMRLTQGNSRALIGFLTNKNFKEIEFRGLDQWAIKAMSNLSPVTRFLKEMPPRPVPELDILPVPDPSGDKGKTFRNTWLMGFRARIVKLIFDAFRPGGDGFFYIGACPRGGCGKVFERPRADSVYCSKYCMNEIFRTTKHK